MGIRQIWSKTGFSDSCEHLAYDYLYIQQTLPCRGDGGSYLIVIITLWCQI
jgi:hypothetical protein